MIRQEIIRLIPEAGHEPFECDTLYRPVSRAETSVTVQVSLSLHHEGMQNAKRDFLPGSFQGRRIEFIGNILPLAGVWLLGRSVQWRTKYARD